MNSYKRMVESLLLHRMAHADVFEIGTKSEFLFVLFGGSGVDEEEYRTRSATLIPVFDKLLALLRREKLSFALIHSTAPYDITFNRFANDSESAAIWNQHVLTELLAPWTKLPYFIAGFSGGVTLALHGLQAEPRCFGAAAFGGDAIPSGFTCPTHWKYKLRSYIAPLDAVAGGPANRQIEESLINRGQLEEIRLRSGGHRLSDYARQDGLGDAIRFANGIASDISKPTT